VQLKRQLGLSRRLVRGDRPLIQALLEDGLNAATRGGGVDEQRQNAADTLFGMPFLGEEVPALTMPATATVKPPLRSGLAARAERR
jgi:hypothetical protein